MPPQIWGYEEVLRRYNAFSNACPEPTGLVPGNPARNHRVNVLNLTEKNYGRWIFWFSRDSGTFPPPPQIEEISSNEEVVGYEISGIRRSVELPVCFLGRSRCQVHVDIVVSYVAQFLSPRFESKDDLCHLLIWGDLLKKIENPKIESWSKKFHFPSSLYSRVYKSRILAPRIVSNRIKSCELCFLTTSLCGP